MKIKKGKMYMIKEDGLVEKQFWGIKGKIEKINNDGIIIESLKNKDRRYLVNKECLIPINNNIIKI